MSSIEHLIPGTRYQSPIQNNNLTAAKYTANMGRILSVDPEILRLDIRGSTRSTISTAVQNPDILRVLAVGAGSLEPSITSSSARRNNLTCFPPEHGKANILFYSIPVPVTKDRILMRNHISPISLVDAWHRDMIFFKLKNVCCEFDRLSA